MSYIAQDVLPIDLLRRLLDDRAGHNVDLVLDGEVTECVQPGGRLRLAWDVGRVVCSLREPAVLLVGDDACTRAEVSSGESTRGLS